MSIVNIISAIGNNSSIYPLLVRDCGIEAPSKVLMTYNQNKKDSNLMAKNAVRERLIDEYATSAIWLGGIPFMNQICDKIIEKLGYNPNINLNLFKENSEQGINKNIEKFKSVAEKETSELKKVLQNKSTYEKLLAGKFIVSTTIPVILMGFVLPKLNFALTEKIKTKQSKEQNVKNDIQKKSGNNPTFKGTLLTNLANMSTVNKMAVTDGGLTVGRVYTARNKFEKWEMAFKMTGMMFLNFVAPIWIAKFFDKTSNKLFNTNVNLNLEILSDENFIEAIKTDSLNLPKKGKLIEFLDAKPNEKFSKLVEQFCDVKRLKNGIRDPRYYVDIKKIEKFKSDIEKFIQQAKNYGDVEKFAQKALKVKSANIITNVALSSFLLAIVLPKVTFILRKKVTGSDAEPGLVNIQK